MYCGWACVTACSCWYWNAWIGWMCDAFAIIVCVCRLLAVTFVVSGVAVIGTTLAFIIDDGAVPITTTPLFTDNVLMQFFCSNVVIFVAATCAPFVCCEIFIKLSAIWRQKYISLQMYVVVVGFSFVLRVCVCLCV